MIPSRLYLFLYFALCIVVLILKILGFNTYLFHIKLVIVPTIFMYYFASSNYKISFSKAAIFLFCFIANVFNVIQVESSPLGTMISLFVANLFVLKLSLDDSRSLEFDKGDWIPTLLLILFIIILCFSILNLQFENMTLSLGLYITYGIVLALLLFISVTNYVKKPHFVFLNAMVLCAGIAISDVFFIINKFYLPLFAFDFIQVFLSVLFYFFMATYFIAIDQHKMKIKKH